MEIALGVITTIIASLTKQLVGESKPMRIVFVFALCFLAAGFYVLFADTNIGQTFMKVLAVSGSFYAFVWSHVERMIAEQEPSEF